MKKLKLFLSMLLIPLSLSARGTNAIEDTQPAPGADPQPGNNRILIVYFSCTNTTKGIAGQIAEVTGGTLHRIKPETDYTTEDLNYNNSSSRANREQSNASARPGISNPIEDLADYDIIFLGYPIWWGKAPKIILTFLESNDFAAKVIVPFCTSGSSGIGSSDTDLHASASGAEWKPGRRFSANTTNDNLKQWIKSMNLTESQ